MATISQYGNGRSSLHVRTLKPIRFSLSRVKGPMKRGEVHEAADRAPAAIYPVTPVRGASGDKGRWSDKSANGAPCRSPVDSATARRRSKCLRSWR